jgi:DNA repair protein RecN (Recombination protein N)
MIVELSVENLAIIESAKIELNSGFTVLTGETGAGKSLLVDAVELALGVRAESDLVRTGHSRAVVNLVADVSRSPALRQKCQELGLTLEDHSLYVQREVFAEGRSQCRIGGKLTPVSVLRQLGLALVDLHGQHDHQSLLSADRHVNFLDDWIGQEATNAAHAVSDTFDQWEQANRQLTNLRANQRDREHRLDLLRFQCDEIDQIAPQPGEMEVLEGQLTRLQHSEKLSVAILTALQALSEDDDSVMVRSQSALRSIDDAARIDPSLEALADPLRSAYYQVEDAIRGLRSYSDALEADPGALEETAQRIDALRRLRRKYGETEEAVLDYRQEIERERTLLEDADANEADLSEEVDRTRKQFERACEELTNLRVMKAAQFSTLVQAELHDLAMERASFSVHIGTRTADRTGADAVEFFFSANIGESPRPLAKIASGGELSRVMLAIKCASAGRAGVPTLIFDEVDAGLGGRAAAVVARKLDDLASYYQVVVISHLPQIAAKATSHFRIEKRELDGRIRTEVRALGAEERVEEIARMLAGETISELAIANAREMLKT